jgi:hypothetical protein
MKAPKPGGTDTGDLILYRTEDGRTQLEVRLVRESLWLSGNQIAALFKRDKSVIFKHIKSIFEDGELDPAATVARFATVQTEGGRTVSREIEFYRLEVVLAVGYRVRSALGTQFRQWATARLEEYLVKGFTMDDERLKQDGGGNYFDELLDRIRDIRSSERVFWRKVLDIYATSVDYDPSAEASRRFFAVVQNKMHWAAHGHTAAEIVAHRVDSAKPNMGLTAWSGRRPTLADAGIAKNYLSSQEIETLNLIVSAYLDFAELQALNRKPMAMFDWIAKLDDFLRLSDRDLLTHAGSTSHEAALVRAGAEYTKFLTLEDSKPRPVDAHFAEAVEFTRKLGGPDKKKRMGRAK